MTLSKLAIAAAIGLAVLAPVVSSSPNFLVTYTDDQDVVVGGTDAGMDWTNSHWRDNGFSGNKSYSVSPTCCPSRASMLTAKYPHNHHVDNNGASGGCYGSNWIASQEGTTWTKAMHDAGWHVGYIGKYMNKYENTLVIPPGYDYWAGLWGSAIYYDYTLNINGVRTDYGHNVTDYITTVLQDLADDLITTWSAAGYKWVIIVGLPNPHGPSKTLPQYQNSFPWLQAPRLPNFNADPIGKCWFSSQYPPMTDANIAYTDYEARARAESLRPADDMNSALNQAIVDSGVSSSTYRIHTSDHGYQLGGFRQYPSKEMHFEASIRIPLYFKGPGIASGIVSNNALLNIDLGPTILDLAGVARPATFDGRSFAPTLLGTNSSQIHSYYMLEYTADSDDHFHGPVTQNGTTYPFPPAPLDGCFNETYKGLHDLSNDRRIIKFPKETVNCWELYNMRTNAHQLGNEYTGGSTALKNTLSTLSSCAGITGANACP